MTTSVADSSLLGKCLMNTSTGEMEKLPRPYQQQTRPWCISVERPFFFDFHRR
jgi:hypothetical protein